MIIISDTREQRNSLVLEGFSKLDVKFKVKKLDYGDYSIEGYEDKIIIEKKNSLTELAGSFTSGRRRFEAEFIRAKEAGAKIILLIEEADGRERLLLRRELDKDKSLTDEQRQKKTWRTNFCANSFIASLTSWKEKYDIKIVFCSKREAGKVIIDIFNEYLYTNV